MELWTKWRKEFRPGLETLNDHDLEELNAAINFEIESRYMKRVSDAFLEQCKQTTEMFNSFRFPELQFPSVFDVPKKKEDYENWTFDEFYAEAKRRGIL
jgi:hypothetical protein